MKKGLIVFAREPLPGKVKTRLAASLGDQLATRMYENMLHEVLKTTLQLCEIETIVFWDCEEESLPMLAKRYRCNSRSQNPGNLGQRMQTAFEVMFADGYDICCIIGSDCPDLPTSYILEAYHQLEMQHCDAVFGPSRDGGYYLLGLRQVWPKLFMNISWSSSEVLEQSLAAAKDAGMLTALLSEWQDIDTVEDLRAYQERNQGSS
ncbi:MAG: TIGR04282 family arsenosugar biosynthesis glycosyltransferase [Desulfuromonadaceae bacterium]|nr:TIGR04282 family arsenosugar biosynthesis glycosyltransferase [Desulfuromonadaceae bacterium]